MKRYIKIAQLCNRLRDKNPTYQEWIDKAQDELNSIMRNAPSGSGIDAGTKLCEDRCTDQRLVFECGYHHMNEGGYYDGWTEHKVIITASLSMEFDLRITGRNRNQIKEYLGDVYHTWLNEEIS